MPRHHKTHERVSLVTIDIPENIRRDIILESDPVFEDNARALYRADMPTDKRKAIRDWLILAALRRAHIPARQSLNLASA